jgi:4-carboxymuconolactone decarboxylase
VRLPDLNPDELTSRQREVAEDLIRKRNGGPLRGPFRIWLRNAELCDRVQNFGAHVRFDSGLPPRLVELGLMVTARHWDAQYPWSAHYDRTIAGGIPVAAIEAIASGREPEFERDDDEVFYRMCRQLLTDHFLSDDVFEAAVRHFGEEGVVEAVASVGYYTTLCMTLNAFQVDLLPDWDPPFPDVRGFARVPVSPAHQAS